MLTDEMIEQRLAAVESAIVQLQHQISSPTPVIDWVERFTGAFQDEPAFDEVVAYGRALREADRPREPDVS